MFSCNCILSVALWWEDFGRRQLFLAVSKRH
jgi:hypothetical protein